MRISRIAPALAPWMLCLSAYAMAGQSPSPPKHALKPAEPPANPTASRTYPHLAHIGYAVRDAERAAEQTLTQLHLPRSSVVVDVVFPVTSAKYMGDVVDYTIDLKIIDTGNTQLEYIQPLEGRSPYSDALANGDDAVVHHLALVVPSIDERLEAARQEGLDVTVVVDAPLPGGARFVYAEGILPGLLVELIEVPAAAGNVLNPEP